MYLSDVSGKVVWCTEQFAECFGLTPTDINGESIYILMKQRGMSAEAIRANKTADEEAIAGTQSGFEQSITLNGTKEDYLVLKSPLLGSNNKAIGIAGVFTNITKQKLVERSLEEEANLKSLYLENVLSHIPCHMYWMGPDGKIINCNELQAKNFGFASAEDLKGKNIYDVAGHLGWPPSIAEDTRKNDLTVMQTGARYSCEEQVRIEDKDLTFLAFKEPLKNRQGETIGVFGFSVDITPQKQLEKMTSRAETLRLISASMAHELRTPLRTIDAGLHYLQDQLADRKDLLEVIEDSRDETKAAFNVIDMLLIKADWSKISSTKFKSCSISECVENAISRYPFDGADRSLVGVKLDEDFSFHGDQELMAHVLFNLLKNAIYYIKVAGKGEVQIWASKAGKYNELHFKDTGSGISSKVLPHIFEKFYTKTPHGTGVGLAFCKLVMESFGGKIDCSSKEGEFAEFVLYFPSNQG
jgi:PAS domain S-box-containing protein